MTNYTQWKSLVDLHEYSAIPDSAIIQWEFSGLEASDTTAPDSIGDENLSLVDFDSDNIYSSDDFIGGTALQPGNESDSNGWPDNGFAKLDKKLEPVTGGNDFSIGLTYNDRFGIPDESNYIIQNGERDVDGVFVSFNDGEFRVSVSNPERSDRSESNLPSGTHRVLITFDDSSNEIEIYVDGDQQGDGTNGNSVPGDVDFQIGGDRDDARCILPLDNVIVYDEVLESDDIQKDFDVQPFA